MKLRDFWVFLFPLLFIPSVGTTATDFGNVTTFDYVLPVYTVAVALAAFRSERTLIDQIRVPGILFLAWALASILSIPVRYETGTEQQLLFSGVKWGKVVLSTLAGYFTVKAVSTLPARSYFDWAVLVAGLVVGISAYTSGGEVRFERLSTGAAIGYMHGNGVAVLLALPLVYLFALYSAGHGTQLWRTSVLPAVGIMMLAIFYTGGRGGMLGALAGLFYIQLRRGFDARALLGVAAAIGMGVYAYSEIPSFTHEVDNALYGGEKELVVGATDEEQLALHDGGRVGLWLNQAPRLLLQPLFGSGFYHRSLETTYYIVGAHNQWIQYTLETGIIGGIFLFTFLARLWRLAGAAVVKQINFEMPVHAHLVTVIACGMSGEYFYGSPHLISVFAFWAPVGSIILRQQIVDGKPVTVADVAHLADAVAAPPATNPETYDGTPAQVRADPRRNLRHVRPPRVATRRLRAMGEA
jgi:hypothetical protein